MKLRLNAQKFLGLISIMLCTLSTYGQVTGLVTDETGEPLIGVNISLVSDPAVGATTEIDGTYTINAEAGDVLSFSYIGYGAIEKEVPVSLVLNVQMGELSELLNEVVVVGYGAVKKEDLTGTVAKIGEKDFNKGPVATPERLLNGKVPGLQITTGGEPGAGSSITLRGQSSINASSRPLIVVDGVPLDDNGVSGGRNPLNFINAADVESMTVLKDASAAAIYGSRGASGVIIITTKSGKSGKPTISYSGNVNTSLYTGNSGFLSPNNFRNAILAKAPQEYEFLGEASTDWVDEVTQMPLGMEHNLSARGGIDKWTYNVSAGYLNSKGVIQTSQHEKKSIAANIGGKLFDDQLTLKATTRTSFLDDRFAPGVLGSALSYDPTRAVLDPDSEYGGYTQWGDALATANPVSTLNLTENKGSSVRTLNSLTLTYDLPWVEGLSVTSQGSYDYQNGDSRLFRDPTMELGTNFDNGGFLSLSESTNKTKQIESFATYKKDIGWETNLTLTAGHSWLETDRRGMSEFGNQLMMDNSEYIYTADIEQDSFAVTNRLASFFGRANFNIKEKYLLTATVRRDGSSRFGESNRWGTFPAVAVGWRILQEDWASSLSNTFDNLKLRLSYGVTGNERIGDYLYSVFYRYGSQDARYQFGDQFVQTLRGTGVDPEIKWEETRSANLGIDFGLWDNRISGTIDVYERNTDDLLFNAATSAFTNLSDRVTTNIGSMKNRGLEIGINTVMLDKESFGWDFNLNYATNSNEITKLDNSNDTTFIAYETGGISGDVGQTIQLLQKGESFNSFRVYEHIMDANGNPLNDQEDWNSDGIANLLDMYVDQNGDGVINENDLIVYKNPAPKHIIGFTNNFRYKNWDLAATLRANIGNYVYNNVASASGYYQRLTDRVTNNIHKSAFNNDFQERQLKSSIYVEDASFLKLDNVTLSYRMRDNNLFKNMRLYVTGSNLLTLTNYSGADPEVFNGIDNNQYPYAMNLLFGLSAQF